jgi:uncharacterized alkaline shock family protein YloU
MAEQDISYGQIEVSPAAIITVVSQSVHQCYGVVGMASKGFVNGIAQLLSRDTSKKGIEVKIEEEGIVVDVYVVVEYGIRIRAVAESVQNSIKFHIERTLGQPVKAVNVYVQGLRMNVEEKEAKSKK